MNYIMIIIICILLLIMVKLGLDVKFKSIKLLNNESSAELSKIGDKLPDSKEICSSILKNLHCSNVKIQINEEYNSCLYTVFNNTITIGKFKEDYMKPQTIAHECIHACQNKLTLWSNFVISNICNCYFLITLILLIFNKVQNINLLLLILVMFFIVKFIIRSFLENEAMIKAKYIAKEYLEESDFLSEKEIEKLLKQYDKVNKIGIPFYNFYLFSSENIKIIICCILALI